MTEPQQYPRGKNAVDNIIFALENPEYLANKEVKDRLIALLKSGDHELAELAITAIFELKKQQDGEEDVSGGRRGCTDTEAGEGCSSELDED